MKKVGVALILISILINCQESKDRLHSYSFSKDAGRQIPTEVAERWANRCRTTNKTSKTQNFSLSASTLREILNSGTQKLGVLLHHATDDNDQHHVLLILVEEYQPIWSTQIIFDANGEAIPTSTARAWAEKYKLETPQNTWAHFFGIHVFDEIFADEGFEQMDVVPAIDDLGRQKLLLYIWTAINSNGRAHGEELTVYDKSTDCPPCEII